MKNFSLKLLPNLHNVPLRSVEKYSGCLSSFENPEFWKPSPVNSDKVLIFRGGKK